jgi:undecaprenyl-diphosphatase
MVIPLIIGKIAKDIYDGVLSTDSANLIHLGLGFIAAFICGLIACTWMISLVRKSKLTYFAIYCVVIGLTSIIISFFN